MNGVLGNIVAFMFLLVVWYTTMKWITLENILPLIEINIKGERSLMHFLKGLFLRSSFTTCPTFYYNSKIIPPLNIKEDLTLFQ
jgi:hypothetical protein